MKLQLKLKIMYLIEHKNSLYRVSETFFKTKNFLSKEEYEEQLLEFPLHSKARAVSDKEFAELELKNWHR
jgi:hypothetical protein